MKELELQSRIISLLNAYGWARRIVSPGRRGIPDIVAVINGCTFFLEVKIGKGRLSKIQMKEIENINKNGGEAIVVRGEEDVSNFILPLAFPKSNDFMVLNSPAR